MTMEDEYEDALFSRIREYLQEYDSASIQKKSFDFFIHHRLPRIIEEEPTINVPLADGRVYRVSFGQVFVDKPYIIDENRNVRYITPNEARIRELTYSSLVSVNIRTSIVESDEVERDVKDFFKIHLARIPMMIGTSKCNLFGKNTQEKCQLGECRYDTGGYFIIKGKERVLVSQERMNYNIVYVFEQKSNSKFSLVGEIRSMSDETGHSVLVQMKICNDIMKRTVVQIPYITQEVPLGYVFRAYGFSVQEMKKILQFNLQQRYADTAIQKIVRVILRDAEAIDSQEKAIHAISQFSAHTISKERRTQYVSQILNNELFPHLGITSSRNQKGFFLGHMFHKLAMTYLGERPEDDRDHINNKRVEAAGHLMGELFRTLFKRFVRAMEPQLSKRSDVIVIMSRMNMITQGIKHCFSTGNWGIPKSSYIRTGVSQILSRLTYNSFLSHLRRIIIPIGKEGKNTKIRQIHPSQIGFICPSETPEGHSAGIVKNMTITTQITFKSDSTFLRMVLESTPGIICGFDFDRFVCSSDFKKIFLNGNWIGISYDMGIYDKILEHRRLKRLPLDVSISFNEENEIFIFGDEGRMMRPLFNCQNMPTMEDLQQKTFSKLWQDNQIQFLDSHEIENKVLAMDWTEAGPSYDYCELHPSLLVGLCVGLIPYVDHTQAPRVTYHASMGKQAIGIYATTNNIRTDTISHVLTYPERPLVRTHISEATGCDELASGNNLIVAIAMYTGFNQEDSVILNQSSIMRGMFRSMSFRTIVVEERKKSTMMSESIEMPSTESRIKSFNFSKLDEQGIVRVGSFVGSGDVIVARVQIKTSKQGLEEKTDASVIIKSGEEGYVDRVFVSTSPDGYKIVKIKMRSYKIPEIGDKVCSRNAQKGTVGITLPQEDMPFTASGIVPDIIINPLCFTADTMVNTSLGLAKRIVELSENEGQRVIAFDVNKELFCDAISLGMEYKGRAATIHLIFDDGSTVTCTPDHEFYTKDSGWCQAQDLDQHSCIMDMGLMPVDQVCPREQRWMSRNRIRSREEMLAIARVSGYAYLVKDRVIDWHNADTCQDFAIAGHVRIIPNMSLSDTPFSFVREFCAAALTPIAEIGTNQRVVFSYRECPFRRVVHIIYYLRKIFQIPIACTQDVNIFSVDMNVFNRYIGFRHQFEKSVRAAFLTRTMRRLHSIQRHGVEKVYCIGVKRHHNFVAEGMVVKNCLPSRMTINQVIECLAAKCAVSSGKFKYSTAFSRHSHNVVDRLCTELHELGFQRHGYETMYNGFTGEILEASIFMGPTYYQRLKHLVGAKIHARNHGSIQALTRQPLEGRSRDGGLRFGEMERDAMISHGVSRFLTERLFDMSDKFSVPVCSDCGAMPNELNQCMMCSCININRIPIPYACKLLFQELQAMGIKVNLVPVSEA